MIVVLLGPPGAGKGTQAEKLSKKLGLKHLATGDLLREAVAKGTDLGKEAQSYMSRGELVPDSIVCKIVEEKIKEGKDGFILDGFPRNINQAKELDQYLRQFGRQIDKVINIEISEDEIVKRLTRRVICSKCGKIYSLDDIDSDTECPNCGGRLQQRKDDNIETIKNRIKIYKKETAPLIDYYRQRGILKNVSGEESPNKVFLRLLEAL